MSSGVRLSSRVTKGKQSRARMVALQSLVTDGGFTATPSPVKKKQEKSSNQIKSKVACSLSIPGISDTIVPNAKIVPNIVESSPSPAIVESESLHPTTVEISIPVDTSAPTPVEVSASAFIKISASLAPAEISAVASVEPSALATVELSSSVLESATSIVDSESVLDFAQACWIDFMPPSPAREDIVPFGEDFSSGVDVRVSLEDKGKGIMVEPVEDTACVPCGSGTDDSECDGSEDGIEDDNPCDVSVADVSIAKASGSNSSVPHHFSALIQSYLQE
jgi:hypothetical protein